MGAMAAGGALVKNIFVRIRTDGAGQAKTEMDDIAQRARAIGNLDPKVKLTVEDKAARASLAAFRLELAGLKFAGDQAGLQDLAARLRAVGDSADAPRVKMSALRLELDAAKSAAGLAAGALGGGGGAAAGGGGGLAGILAGLGPGGVAGGAGIAAGAIAGLASGLQGIVPAAVAAGMGLGAFGAFALPTLRGIASGWSAVNTAVSNYQAASATLDIAIHRSAADLAAYHATIRGVEPDLRSAAALLTDQTVQWQNLSPAMRKNVIALSDNSAELKKLLPDQRAALAALLAQASAWNALPAAQRPLAAGLQALDTQFQKLVTTMAPLTLQVFNEGIKIASTLLPQMLPFAQAAGKAIDGLLKGFEAFAKSPGFREWQQQMLALAGPMITTVGTGLGQIAVAAGKLLIALSNPEALRTFKYLLEGVAVIITGLAVAFRDITGWAVRFYHDVASAFDRVRHAVAAGWDTAVHAIERAFAPFVSWWHAHAEEIKTIWATVEPFVIGAWHLVVDALKVGMGILAGIWRAGWDLIGGVLRTAWHLISDVVSTAVHVVLDVIGIALDLLTGHWNHAWHDLIHLASDALHGVISIIKDLTSGFGTLLWNAGADLIKGLIGGIGSMAGNLGSALLGLGRGIVGDIGHALGIGSPSKITFYHGQMLGQGLIDGMASEIGRVRTSAAQLAAAAAGGPGGRGYATAAGAMAGPGSGGWIEAKLVIPRTGDQVIDTIMKGAKLYIRNQGGGGTNSVQRALGFSY